MSSTERRSRGARSAGSSTLVTVVLGTAVAFACGGENESLFQDPAGGAAGAGSGGGNATGGGGLGGAAGGAGRPGGTGGVAVTGGSSGDTSGSAGRVATGGAGNTTGGAGGTTGGAGGVPGGTGGSAGDATTGGSGGMTTGSGGDTTTGGAGGLGGTAGMGATAGAAGSGGTMAGSSGTGASSGTGGVAGTAGKGGKADCNSLQATARNALAQAQVCSFTEDGAQCTGVVDDLCGCAVPVNDENSAATAKYLVALKALDECGIVCAAVVCIEPAGATCVRTTAGSGTGTCRVSAIGL
jgi:hypothetical protein